MPYLPENEESRLSRQLSQAMQEHGNEIRTFMPRYGCVNERRNQLHEVIRLSGMNLIINDDDHQLIIKVSSIPSARIQIYFIDNAERLTPAVQNKLLKVFEEPPKDVIIALFAKSTYGILQTIKSRAKLNYLPTFTAEDIHNALVGEGYPRAQAEIASALSGGSFEKAYAFVQDENYYNQYSECFEVLKNCKKSTMVVEYINKPLFSKDNIRRTLEFFEIILRDVAVKVSGAKIPYITRNRDYDIAQISEGYTTASVAMAILEVNRGEAMLDSYISNVSVAERVLFKILEAKYKWQ